MDGWKTILFPFGGFSAYFKGRTLGFMEGKQLRSFGNDCILKLSKKSIDFLSELDVATIPSKKKGSTFFR